MTMTSATSPNWLKYSRTPSGVVCQLNPPMNILPGSLGISSPGDMKLPRLIGVKGENMPERKIGFKIHDFDIVMF